MDDGKFVGGVSTVAYDADRGKLFITGQYRSIASVFRSSDCTIKASTHHGSLSAMFKDPEDSQCKEIKSSFFVSAITENIEV
jgi:hypothetical protein